MKRKKEQLSLKPLSPMKYLLNNSGKSLGMIIALGLSIFMILIAQMVFYSVTEGPRLGNSFTNVTTVVYSGNLGEIDYSFYKELENQPQVERIIKMYDYNTDYYHFFGAANIKMFFVGDTDIDYFLEKTNMKLVEGRMPRPGKNEVLLDWRMANNKNKKVGDFIGKGANPQEKIFGMYEIVGILKGPCIFGICSVESNQIPDNSRLLVFPKKGKLDQLNEWLSSVSEDKAKFWSKDNAYIDYQESVETINKLSGVAFIGVIFVMAFAAGNACYSQYFSRRYEYGVLQAIGYNKKQILLKASREIFLLNCIGFAGGMFLGILIGVILHLIFFIPNGYPFLILQPNGLLEVITIPTCTILFGLIPSGFLLSRIDPMIAIEKFE